MNRFGLAVMAAAFLAFSPMHAASDEGLASAVLACSAQPDDKAQLVCYNAIAARLKAAQAAAPASAAAPAATPPVPATVAAAPRVPPPPPAAPVAQAPKPEGGSWYDPRTWFDSSEPARTTAARAGNPAEFGSETLPEGATDQPARLDQISAKVAGVSYNYFRRFTVTLNNGQVWRQLDSDTSVARFGEDGGETVTIKRGLFGFGLKIEDRSGSYQVKRIK